MAINYSTYTETDARIYLELVNKVREQNFLPAYIYTNYQVPDEQGQFVGQGSYTNQIEFFFENEYVLFNFQTLSLKDETQFTTFENDLFGTVWNDYRVNELELEPFEFSPGKAISEFFNNFNVEPVPPDNSYTDEETNTFFTILNNERQERGLDPILVPNNIETDPITWFFDVKNAELPEFNSPEMANLYKEIKIWAVSHVVIDDQNSVEEVRTLGVFTVEEDALLQFTTLNDLDPDQPFFLSELELNTPINFYIPPQEEDYPDWLKALQRIE